MPKSYLLNFLLILTLIFSCIEKPTETDLNQYLWPTSTPREQGMNQYLLESALNYANEQDFVDGLLVIKNGFIVAEDYYNGYNALQSHNVMSVSKSFLSAIAGIALYEGYLTSIDESILTYFPEFINQALDQRKYDITLRHLLTMRMGIRGEAEENYGVYWEIYNSDNWLRKTIESPLVSDPGEKMSYNTFQTHLLSAIITKATHKSILEFAGEVLFKPLQIDIDFWEKDPQGYYFGGNSMYFTPREMAMLGFLYLNNGRFKDTQIIPGDWITLSLSASTNFSHPNAWGAFKDYNYAYLWWLGQINDYDMYMGYGYGGQFVVVFPALNLIVVSTADYQVNPNTSTIQEWAIFDIIATYILPSVDS